MHSKDLAAGSEYAISTLGRPRDDEPFRCRSRRIPAFALRPSSTSGAKLNAANRLHPTWDPENSGFEFSDSLGRLHLLSLTERDRSQTNDLLFPPDPHRERLAFLVRPAEIGDDRRLNRGAAGEGDVVRA